MKTLVLLSIGMMFCYQSRAQNLESLKGTFVIQGKVLNSKEKNWEFAQAGFIGNSIHHVEISNDGSFSKSFKVEGIQEIYLYLNNDAITFLVQPRDTIKIEWDASNFKETFKIGSPSLYRNNELQLNLKLYNIFRNPNNDLRDSLGQNRDASDSSKFSWINNQYNQKLKTVLAFSNPKNSKRIIYQIYYEYTNLLLSNHLLPIYSLKGDLSVLNINNTDSIKSYIPPQNFYRLLSDKYFYECPQYREFLYNYIRFSSAFEYISITYSKKDEVLPSTPRLSDFYRVSAELKIIPIRDWFISKVIINSYEINTFAESEAVIKDFLPKCKSKYYADTLNSFYTMVKKFKSGNFAPPFSLKDQNGKLVSLKDFKGKIVFINFWGITCAPCRYEIAHAVPKFHEKYSGKDIVFVSICVDSHEETWKKALKEIKLDGINLIAEGWTNNKVCKDYNINGVPHYILIDKQGRFVNANMARPSEIIRGQNKEIDQLLTIK